MNAEHWLLSGFWILYCASHSFLADSQVKEYLRKVMAGGFTYYRPLYSVFASITLALLLWFQLSIQSPLLLARQAILYLPGIVIGITGLSIMAVCINAYFYEQSGLQALRQKTVKYTLQQSGLHKYVRHPLYLGTLSFLWGLLLIFPLLSNVIAASIITLYVLLGISLEEKKLYAEYGDAYRQYSKKVPKIIPRIYKIKKGSL